MKACWLEVQSLSKVLVTKISLLGAVVAKLGNNGLWSSHIAIGYVPGKKCVTVVLEIIRDFT